MTQKLRLVTSEFLIPLPPPPPKKRSPKSLPKILIILSQFYFGRPAHKSPLNFFPRSAPDNPRGNGQVERYNGIVWQKISLALKSRSLETKQWESVLLDALHSIRSLLCTATNTTPHEMLFSFKRRSTNGQSILTWLTEPGKVFGKKHARASKYDLIVEEADLIHANLNMHMSD